MDTAIKNKYHLSLSFVFRALFISFFSFICILVIIFFIYCGIILSNSNRNSFPLFSSYIIVTQSMVPTINVDDAIVVKRLKNNDYKIGDIITFKSSDVNYQGLTITHRIVGVTSSGMYITKGDNNFIADSASVSANSIYGKVFLVIPKLGYLQRFLSKSSSAYMCVLISLFVLFFINGFKILKFLLKRTGEV